MFAVIKTWYKNIAGRFFGLVNGSEFAEFRLY